MSDEEAKITTNDVEDEDVPELEDTEAATGMDKEAAAQMAQRVLGGKQPKRYAKAMQKMGLKPEPGVLRVSIKKTNAMAFSIAKPEVYRFPNTNTFVIFGEAQVEEATSDAQKAAARTVTQPAAEPAPAAAATAEGEDDADEDAGDIADKEIEIVMSQASVSRGRAIRALKNNNGDIVNAIMELTM